MDELVFFGAFILAIIVIIYVILDGFNIGVGVLFPWIKDEHERDLMKSSVAPVWDGNETWMVLGAACLYGMFPRAYSSLLPLLYIPILLMLVMLIFRGITFEFRFKISDHRSLWSMVFAASSFGIGFIQGLILGAMLQGVGESGKLLWLSPFSILTGFGVVIGYALLGSCWLIIKTEGHLQDILYCYAKRLMYGVLIFMALVSVISPIVNPEVYERWLAYPNIIFLLPFPFTTGLLFISLGWHLYHRNNEWAPFALAASIFVFGYIGQCISIWPYIIPYEMTFAEAAAPESSMVFILAGLGLLLPVLILYSVYSYSVFKGKIKEKLKY